jgi:hypothetical protein
LRHIIGVTCHTFQTCKQEYIRDTNNQLKSAKLLLEEYNYEIILMNIEDEINYLGFITPFFELLLKNKEIVVNATCK